ncbi:hypothetical protein TWF481_000777 [Arthrobotrys musiformis]|uniref:Rhodopsin domain-containing protein n=1 Tax=Arthrobotrys musiformis TaxID=47236 RepID=A0AAV9WQL8_9PEZI
MDYLKRAVYATVFLVGGTTVASVFLYAKAYPHTDYWNHPFDSTRVNQLKAQTAITCIFIIADIIIWVLPMPLVMQLMLRPRERASAMCSFSVGVVGLIATAFRLQAIRESYAYDSKGNNGILINAWTIVELNLALIFASVPSVRALIMHYRSRILDIIRSPSEKSDPPTITAPTTTYRYLPRRKVVPEAV